VDGKYSRPTHRDKAAMNGAQTYLIAKLKRVAGSACGPPAFFGIVIHRLQNRDLRHPVIFGWSNLGTAEGEL
jgi:hypothetical protein